MIRQGIIQQGNVTLTVSDLKRSIAFYTERLGLSLAGEASGRWAQVLSPGLTIGLHQAEAPLRAGEATMSIGFTVASLEVAMKALEARGIVFSPKIIEDGSVRLAFFSDPDKHPLYLYEVQKNAV